MGVKTKSPKTRPHKAQPQNSNRKSSKPRVALTSAAAMLSMATQNLINMAAVVAVSGAVLLTLLAARQF